jgi:hypothetical protein
MRTKNKELNKLIKRAQGQGWQTVQVRSGHIKWTSPTGRILFTSFSPSDRHAVKNIQRDLCVNGFININYRKRNKNAQS